MTFPFLSFYAYLKLCYCVDLTWLFPWVFLKFHLIQSNAWLPGDWLVSSVNHLDVLLLSIACPALPNHNTPIAVDTWFNSERRAGQDFTRFSQNVSLLLFSLVAPIIHCILPNKHSLLVFQIVSRNVKFQYILFGFILVPIFLIIMLLIFLLCHRVILGHAIFDPPFLEISHTS